MTILCHGEAFLLGILCMFFPIIILWQVADLLMVNVLKILAFYSVLNKMLVIRPGFFTKCLSE